MKIFNLICTLFTFFVALKIYKKEMTLSNNYQAMMLLMWGISCLVRI